MSFKVIQVDPYHPKLGIMAHYVAQRIIDYAKIATPELDPVGVAAEYMSRLYARRKEVLLLAIVSESATVVGHVAAVLDEPTKYVVINQYRVDQDQNVGDASQEALAAVDDWAATHDVPKSRVSIITTNQGERWAKRGFKIARYIHVREPES